MVSINVSVYAEEGEIILTEGQAFPLILFCQFAGILKKSSEKDSACKNQWRHLGNLATNVLTLKSLLQPSFPFL